MMEQTAMKRNELEGALVRECLCTSAEEASAILDAILENDPTNHTEISERQTDVSVWLQGLQDYLGISEAEASRVLSKLSMRDEEDSVSSSDDSDDEVNTDILTQEEAEDDDGDFIGEGECELCERLIKLTRHHLIPRSTWPRIESRLLQAADAALAGDFERAALIAGPGLEHLIIVSSSTLITLQPDSSNSAKRQWVRNALNRTCEICSPCHANIHRRHPNMVLAMEYNTVDRLLGDDKIRSFSKWASKQRAGKYAAR